MRWIAEAQRDGAIALFDESGDTVRVVSIDDYSRALWRHHVQTPGDWVFKIISKGVRGSPNQALTGKAAVSTCCSGCHVAPGLQPLADDPCRTCRQS